MTPPQVQTENEPTLESLVRSYERQPSDEAMAGINRRLAVLRQRREEALRPKTVESLEWVVVKPEVTETRTVTRTTSRLKCAIKMCDRYDLEPDDVEEYEIEEEATVVIEPATMERKKVTHTIRPDRLLADKAVRPIDTELLEAHDMSDNIWTRMAIAQEYAMAYDWPAMKRHIKYRVEEKNRRKRQRDEDEQQHPQQETSLPSVAKRVYALLLPDERVERLKWLGNWAGLGFCFSTLVSGATDWQEPTVYAVVIGSSVVPATIAAAGKDIAKACNEVERRYYAFKWRVVDAFEKNIKRPVDDIPRRIGNWLSSPDKKD